MNILLLSALAGICGTGLGGALTVLMGKRSSNMICGLLSFAAGVMLSIVCFGLIPEAHMLSSLPITLVGLVSGVIVIMALNRLVDLATDMQSDKLQVHETHEELFHAKSVVSNPDPSKSLLRSGILMLVAIALHNIPEGIAIGAGGGHDQQLGVMLAIMIALHNIPEGMAIAAPLLGGGIGKGRIIYLTALSGAATLIGGILGYLLGNISDTVIAVSLAAAGGAMLYVVFGEIIPQSVMMTQSRRTTLITIGGMVVGMLVSL